MAKQTVVVTGASAGLGRAIVREFAKRKASLGLLARGRDGLEAAQREVEAAGGRALAIPTDVADASQVEAAAELVEKTFGPIDVWVNNAMCSVFSPIKELAADEVLRVTEVTYLGTVYGTLAALRRMLPRNRGVIVQVGSALAYRSIPLQAAYCGAKHAIAGFTDSLRCELIHDHSKVKATMVDMPALNTPQFEWSRSRMPHKAQPVPPIFQPEVGARAVYYAAQHPRRQFFVGGPTVKAIEGQKIIPSLLDAYLGKTGYEAQQTNELENPARPDNLWHPLPGDHGAHGPFDAQAHKHSVQTWMDLHRGWLGGLGVMALLALWFRPRMRPKRMAEIVRLAS